jgi:hypothetical protein
LPAGDPLVGVWRVEKDEFFRDSTLTSRYADLTADGFAATLIVGASSTGQTRWTWGESYVGDVGYEFLYGGGATISGSQLQASTDRTSWGNDCLLLTGFDCVSPLIGTYEFIRTGDQLVIRGLEISEINSQTSLLSPPAWRRLTLRKVR